MKLKMLHYAYLKCHMLSGLAFDVILGFPCIRKYNLNTNFSYLFTESNLQVHNCTKCRQCLPEVFQQESSPSDGETQSKVLLAVLCASAMNLLREPCGVPGWWFSGGSPEERSPWRSCVGPTGADMTERRVTLRRFCRVPQVQLSVGYM
jgi:hypothetical protein